METIAQELDLKNIDKSTWETYRFEEIAKRISESVDPNTTDLKVYVGLEHIDGEDIHIKRFGTPDDVSGGKLKCYPGDVIFGKRRAYQRKAAIVDFEGICSAHAFVFRANKDVIDPKLFPLFLHSDQFMHRMVDISVGGLSPTINWGDLKHQKFLLPPKDQQAQLAELLWTMDKVIEREKEVLKWLEINMDVRASNLIWNKEHRMDKVVKFASTDLKKFVDGDWIESKDQSDSGIRLLQLADIGVRFFINKSSRFINEETFKKLRCFEVLPNDVLVARMPDPIGRACIVEDIGQKMITAVDCCIIRVEHSHSSNRYLLHLLNTREFLHKASLLASGTTRQRIARKSLEEIKVPKPDLEIQIEIAHELDSLYEILGLNKAKIKSSQELQKSLINQIF
ncbi:MAG: restriction endonuclease subunit S [Sphingobacterium sp.]